MPSSLRTLSLDCLPLSSALRHQICLCNPSNSIRQFSSTPSPQWREKHQSKARRQMWRWINGPGSKLRYPRKDSTNYLGAYDRDGNLIRARAEQQQANGEDGGETKEDLRPFPLNPYFRSEAVLSEELRNEVYTRVVAQGKTVREVSIELGVEMSRVGAVVRLKTIEQDWARQGKKLATHYQSAVLEMLPKTPYDPSSHSNPFHESINDLPVHAATLPQLWHPTSESRHFTRVDAGRVFNSSLLPADERIPHPEMIARAKDRLSGMRAEEQYQTHSDRLRALEEEAKEKKRRAKEAEERRTRVVEGRRWDFKFVDIKADSVGKDGRAPTGVGWRYGFPHEDRKRGQVKIPTKVD